MNTQTTTIILVSILVIQINQIEFAEGQEKICISPRIEFRKIKKSSIVCTNDETDSDNISILFLHDSQLWNLPEEAFQSLAEVIEMYLNGSAIQYIHRNAFSRNRKLKRLYLHNNYIRNMEPGSFNLLESLSILDLSGNNIKSLNSTVFDNLESLQVLNLSRNHLTEITNLHFNLSENLEVLDFSYNDITYVDQTVFSKLRKLRQLLLNDNKLKNITLNSLHIPDSILLDLSSNFITTFGTGLCKEFNLNNNEYKDSIKLGSDILRTSNNKISKFTLINKRPEFLNVSYNKIATLSSDNLKEAINLKIADISHNLITKVDSDTFNTLEKLMHLNLSHNFLTEVKYGTFNKLSSLETLDLSFNRFKFLYETPHENVFGFCFLSRLHKVNVDGNLWSVSILNRIKTFRDIYSDLYQSQVGTTTEKVVEPFKKYNFTHLKSNKLMLFLYLQ